MAPTKWLSAWECFVFQCTFHWQREFHDKGLKRILSSGYEALSEPTQMETRKCCSKKLFVWAFSDMYHVKWTWQLANHFWVYKIWAHSLTKPRNESKTELKAKLFIFKCIFTNFLNLSKFSDKAIHNLNAFFFLVWHVFIKMDQTLWNFATCL